VPPSLEILDDAAAFLAVAEDHLARDPVLSTVVASVAHGEARTGSRAPEATGATGATGASAAPPHWYAVVRDAAGAVVGVAMRTAPFEPHPLFVLPMPDEAAVALARLLHARDENVVGVNGALPAARVLAEETARLTGRSVEVTMRTRLFELRSVLPPARQRPPGVLRLADEDDAELVVDWFRAFHTEADEQAGRASGHDPRAAAPGLVLQRLRAGLVHLWEHDGERVHLTARNATSYGAARIGPVFTPREHRGRGYAGAAVALVSQQVLDAGARPCLFTDQANPVSNRLYEGLGYRPVADMADVRVVAVGGRP
jgi:predicted GNAT family acetyltransferase